MNGPRILVAGVGNVLLQDDGFGVEVARRMAKEPLPRGVRVVDYGIRALHLAYDLLEGYDALIIVDAMSRGKTPGTVFVFEPDLRWLEESKGNQNNGVDLDPHGLHPAAVLQMALDLGARLGSVRIVGCEPTDLGEGIGLSEPVENALGEATRIVHDLMRAAATATVTIKENSHVEPEASQ